MLNTVKILNINRSIKGFAREGLSQKEARSKMRLQYGFSDNLQLKIWIATGYCMYDKEKGELDVFQDERKRT